MGKKREKKKTYEEEIQALYLEVTKLKQSEKRLIEAKEVAEAANRAKSEFLANMSHEIRTPISGIVGMIDLTLLTALTVEQKDKLLMAKSCVNSLSQIINDILDFSKMEAGKIVIQEKSFNTRSLIENVIQTHVSTIKKKGLGLNCDISSKIPQFIIGDQKRLFQILNNLMSNAIKFTNHGFIGIEIKLSQTKDDFVELKFSISDTGIGIASEDTNRLFQTFSQEEGSFTKRYSGTGLGLAISKHLVELMGGSIGVDSQFGKGSTFYFVRQFKIGEALLTDTAPLLPIPRICKPHTLPTQITEKDNLNVSVIGKSIYKNNNKELNDMELDLKIMEEAIRYNNHEIILYLVREISEIINKINASDMSEIIFAIENAISNDCINKVKNLIDKMKEEIIKRKVSDTAE